MATGGSYYCGKTEIKNFIEEFLPEHSSILDVGAAGGTYGYFLRDKSYNIDAVEIWQESIDQLKASGWYKTIYEKDIREFEYKKFYDLIIFGDILEHLTVEDAQKVLAEAEKHTSAILIAIPYLLEQGNFYGNEAEIHLQPDLTPEIFDERYPGYTTVWSNNEYGYYFKNTYTEKEHSNMKVCVYAICKNESKFLSQWLKNVESADYIAVLDTGSTDNTYKELKKLQKKNPEKFFIDQKEIKPWRFDVARNESMKLIPEDADILVCTDFDELFTNNWCEILKANWIPGQTNRCHYNYAWSHTESGDRSDMFVYDKIHGRDLHWIFPVHEVLWPIDEENYRENCIDLTEEIILDHYQDKTKSRSSYFDLLKLAVEENPDNPHERMLLAREYLLNGQYDESLEEYLATLKMPKIDDPQFRNVLLESLGRCADLYKIQKNYDEVIWYCQEFIKEDPTYREPYFILGEVYNDMKMYTLGEAMVNAGLKYGTRKYSWIERATTWLGWGNDVLSVSQVYLGDYEEAEKNVKIALRYEPNDTRLLKNYISILEHQKSEKSSAQTD